MAWKGNGGKGGYGGNDGMSPAAMFEYIQQMMAGNPQMMQQMMGKGGGGGGGWGSGKKAAGGGGGGGKKNAGGGGAPAGPAADVNWKGELCCAFSRERKTSATKESVVYTAEETQGPDGMLYTATVSVEGVEFQSKPTAGKKKAEQEAAKLAVKKLFPQHKVTTQTVHPHAAKGSMWESVSSKQAAKTAPGNSKKRKAEDVHDAGEHPKAKLLHGLTVLWGRSLTKEDFSIEVIENDGKFIASLAFPEKQLSFTGETADSKKAADASVCEVALREMQAEIAPAVAEHAANKKIKNQESLKALKERTDAKKAAKKAEAEGAAPAIADQLV